MFFDGFANSVASSLIPEQVFTLSDLFHPPNKSLLSMNNFLLPSRSQAGTTTSMTWPPGTPSMLASLSDAVLQELSNSKRKVVY